MSPTKGPTLDAWQRYLELASGVTGVTRKGAESVVRTLVKQGEVAADRAERAVDELLQRSESNRKVVAALVRTETERAVARLGLAQQADVAGVREAVAALRARLDAAGPDPSATAPAPRPVKTSAAARRAGAVRGTSTARRREAAATEGPATGTATTPPATTSGKKPTGKDSTAKNATAKNATAKKATAENRTAKKDTAEQGTARKGAAKRTAAQRRVTSTAAAADGGERQRPASPEGGA